LQETADLGGISGDFGFPFWANHAIGWRVITVRGRGWQTGRWSTGSVAASPGGGDRLASPAGAASAREIDWQFLDWRFSSVCTAGDGRPPLPTRLVAGLRILKHMHNASDEVRARSG
jgi:hypothetical protein